MTRFSPQEQIELFTSLGATLGQTFQLTLGDGTSFYLHLAETGHLQVCGVRNGVVGQVNPIIEAFMALTFLISTYAAKNGFNIAYGVKDVADLNSSLGEWQTEPPSQILALMKERLRKFCVAHTITPERHQQIREAAIRGESDLFVLESFVRVQ